MSELVVVLPSEVEQLAKNVSTEKRTEVQTVLNHVFNGVAKMREQLDVVEVADQNDKVNMQLARTIRLGVREVRLDAEKTFDAKRTEVQNLMLSYKTEDALWLKAKQTMQLLTKEIEANAKWKEETRERYEQEQAELKVQQRIVQVAKFATDIDRTEFEKMGDESFALFLGGLERQYNDRIEAERKAEQERIEQERKVKLYNDRKETLIPYWNFLKGDTISVDFSELPQESFDIILFEAKQAKKDAEDESERQRVENERLRKEAEAARAAAENERIAAAEKLEAERKATQEAEARLKAKEQSEASAEAARIAAAEAEANKGDADKVKDLVEYLREGKTKFAFKSAKNKKMYADVCILIDKVIQHIEK